MKNKLGSANDGNAPASPLRRKTIKTLAYGVGALAGTTILPDKWVTPIIQGIALPAHAQTSVSGVTFCSGRHELTLVDGHSGTDEMTIEATGCITPAQGNVELEMTLEGYETPAITQKGPGDSGDDNSFLAAVSDMIVPQAHAAPAPKCTVKVKVKTDANGNYKVTFKLNCGRGVVQVVMHGTINGSTTPNIGWLDIHGCNPCNSDSCAEIVTYTVVEPIQVSKDGGATWHESVIIHPGDEPILRNNSDDVVEVNYEYTRCDGVPDGVDVYIYDPREEYYEGVYDQTDIAEWRAYIETIITSYPVMASGLTEPIGVPFSTRREKRGGPPK